MVADMVGGTSRLLTCGESHYLDGLPFTRRSDGTLEMPGILSRKKQLLPAILSALQARGDPVPTQPTFAHNLP